MKTTKKVKRYLIKTYGCQMNHSDSERISSILEECGLKPVKTTKKADIIVFNTCSVRQSAEDRIFGLKKNIHKLKQKRNTKFIKTSRSSVETQDFASLPFIIVTGCMCKRSWDRSSKKELDEEKKYIKSLKKRLAWSDLIIDIKDFGRIPRVLNLSIAKSKNYLDIKPKHLSKFSVHIPISTGCDEFCLYCIVPHARGKQVNKSAKLIIDETKNMVKKDYKEIMLLGQNVNSWINPEFKRNNRSFNALSLNGTKKKSVHRQSFKPTSENRGKRKEDREIYTFLDLLKEVDSIKGDFWLSFLSSHPNYFTNDLIDYFTDSANKGLKKISEGKKLTTGNHIRPYINLALQSGSNKILERMNRKYSVEKFIDICKKLKKRCPKLNLSTDIIVGFPGENEEDFIKTAKVMKELEFDMAYINKYSPRRGTAADKLEDNVSLKEKKRREGVLTEILRNTALDNNQKYIGKKCRVLVEKKKNNTYFGKTFNYKDIKIEVKKKVKIGTFIDVSVKKVSPWSLEGNLINTA